MPPARRHARAGRIALTGTLTLVSLLWLVACSPSSRVCPAVGWVNRLTVELDGEVSRVADVQLCIEQACAPLASGTPVGELAQVGLARQAPDTDVWVFTTGMSAPELFSVRAHDADGAVLADVEVTATWIRVGGSEECGGPGRATVTVQL